MNLEASNLTDAQRIVQELGWQWRNPSNAENTAYFSDVRCERGHRVDGAMVVDTRASGLTYPVGCLCRGQEQEAGALWPPLHIGHID